MRGPADERGHGRPRLARWAAAIAWAVVWATAEAPVAVAQPDPAGPADPVVAALQPGRTLSARATLRTTNAGGAEDDLTLDWARSTDGDRVRVAVEVVAPPYMAGTVHQWTFTADGGIDRRVFSPERGRTSRIRGDRPTDPFLSSAFAYEDLGLAPSPARVGAERRPLSGEGRARTLLVSSPYHFYSEVETIFDDETGLPVEALYRDRAGQPFRRVTWSRPKSVDGLWVPTRIEAVDLLSGEGSVLEIDEVRLDVRLDARLFDPDFGGRPMRRGATIDVPSPGESPELRRLDEDEALEAGP